MNISRFIYLVNAMIIKSSLYGLMVTICLSISYAQESRINVWQKSFPNTDFSKANVNLAEIMEGGPGRGGIPSIDFPKFSTIEQIKNIGSSEPVISVDINGDARAYPIRILMFHEIVNDIVDGVPIIVTYCPLCNASIVFESRIDGRILTFEATGNLRKSDMVMYDQETESWWQQFTGEAIVGEFTGRNLKIITSRIESYKLFKERHPDGRVLVPNNPKLRDYGNNPYVGYDTEAWPFLYDGTYDDSVPPLTRVVAVGKDAWPLTMLRDQKTIVVNDMTLLWTPGQNSALSSDQISRGRDIGNVTVIKNGLDVPYHLPFAFAFKAFHPDGNIHRRMLKTEN